MFFKSLKIYPPKTRKYTNTQTRRKTNTMNRSTPFTLFWCWLICANSLSAQISHTANDAVSPYHEKFHNGVNLGAYHFWRDEELANIAAGNPDLDVPGVGVNALRLSLPENFLDYWGYDIRLDAFQHYDHLGMEDNVVFLGYPAPHHRDTIRFCPDGPSQLFANMYLPIWDNGENGTPVNDDNYCALYIYKMAQVYHPYVKFWEVWNEPDFDFVGDSSRQPGEEGNWWEHDPDPCHYALHAPVQHYIRLLRISYEVIKYVAPDDFVAIGGIGYPSFLDLVLRNTDNPDSGKVDSQYPLTGGAYFDVLSYHSYPHIDNSLRAWSNDIWGFIYFRHSDKCVDGMLNLQAQMRTVLEKYGYDGATFPEKHWIITENNIPRKQFGEYIGSPEAQRNYLIKAAVGCQMNDILQLHVYQLGDIEPEKSARNEFDLMGLYHELDSVPKYEQKITDAGIAYHTVSTMLRDKRFDPARTAQMQLPAGIRGGAFRDDQGLYVYVLWAVTSLDQSEEAEAIYSFPNSMGIQSLHQREWDFSKVSLTTFVSASQVKLKGSPVFLTDSRQETPAHPSQNIGLSCTPNPFGETISIQLTLPSPQTASLALFDISGRQVSHIFSNLQLAEGSHFIPVETDQLPAGMYLVRLKTSDKEVATCKLVRE